MTAFRLSGQPAAAPRPSSLSASRALPRRHRALTLAVKAALAAPLGLLGGAILSAPAYAQQASAAQGGNDAAAANTNAAGIAAPASAATPASAAALGEILVTAERDRSATQAGTTTIIGGDELGRRNAADMSAIARYQPLINVPLSASGQGSVWDSSGNTGFNIRGVEGNRVSLDIDGIAMPDAAPKPDSSTTNSFGIGRDYFDPETFREVRISSGTSAAGAGTPGLGGGVAFLTKAPEDYLNANRNSYAEYKLGYDSVDASRSHVLTGALRLGAVQLMVVAIHRDGEQNDNNGSVAANPQDWHSDALLAKANWTIDAHQKLGLTLDAYKRVNDSTLYNLSTYYPYGAEKDATTRRNRLSLQHAYTGAGSPLFDTLSSRVYVQDARAEDVTDALYTFGGNNQRHITTGLYTKTYGLASDATKRLSPANLLTYGLAYEHSEIRRPWLENRLVVATGVRQVTIKNRMADTDGDKVSAYASDDYTFDLGGHKAVLTPGLRAEFRELKPKNLENYLIAVPAAAGEIKDNKEGDVTPSLSLAVNLTTDLLTYAQYKRGARLPTPAERTGTYDSFSYTGAGNGYATMGNPDLKKETSNAFELGLKGTAAKGLTFSASVFYTRYHNYIDYVRQPDDPVNYPTITQGLFRVENLAKAEIWGAELASRFELGSWSAPLRGVSIDLAAGIAHSSAENTATGKTGELSSTQPFKGTAGLAYDDAAGRFGLALTGVYTDAKQLRGDPVTGSTTNYYAVPSSTVFDLSTYWIISKNVKLNAGVYNLADRQYWDYASTRTLAAGTTATTLAEIQREARPGRNYGVSLSVNY